MFILCKETGLLTLHVAIIVDSRSRPVIDGLQFVPRKSFYYSQSHYQNQYQLWSLDRGPAGKAGTCSCYYKVLLSTLWQLPVWSVTHCPPQPWSQRRDLTWQFFIDVKNFTCCGRAWEWGYHLQNRRKPGIAHNNFCDVKLCRNNDAALQVLWAPASGQTLNQYSLGVDPILFYGHGQKATQLQGA